MGPTAEPRRSAHPVVTSRISRPECLWLSLSLSARLDTAPASLSPFTSKHRRKFLLPSALLIKSSQLM